MHIADGVLNTEVVLGGLALTGVITAITIRKIKSEDIPKIAIMTAAFFVASLIHIPLPTIPPTSVHLILNGLMGIILGIFGFPSILVGLFLQSIIFQHGGLLVLGVNTLIMGLPALFSGYCFQLVTKRYTNKRLTLALFGGLLAGLAILLSTFMVALVLHSLTEQHFLEVAKIVVPAHLPIAIIEGLITYFVIMFLIKTRPEIINITRKN